MKRSAIVPHISWHGPQPEKETDAYLLAMLLRICSAGFDSEEDDGRDTMLHPSILTTKNLGTIAMMYAFYKHRMEEIGVRSTEDMLKMVKETDEGMVEEWLPANRVAMREAEAELLEYVETPGNPGFSAFG